MFRLRMGAHVSWRPAPCKADSFASRTWSWPRSSGSSWRRSSWRLLRPNTAPVGVAHILRAFLRYSATRRFALLPHAVSCQHCGTSSFSGFSRRCGGSHASSMCCDGRRGQSGRAACLCSVWRRSGCSSSESAGFMTPKPDSPTDPFRLPLRRVGWSRRSQTFRSTSDPTRRATMANSTRRWQSTRSCSTRPPTRHSTSPPTEPGECSFPGRHSCSGWGSPCRSCTPTRYRTRSSGSCWRCCRSCHRTRANQVGRGARRSRRLGQGQQSALEHDRFLRVDGLSGSGGVGRSSDRRDVRAAADDRRVQRHASLQPVVLATPRSGQPDDSAWSGRAGRHQLAR